MLKPFEDMPGLARLWIYQADRKLTSYEAQVVEGALRKLCEEWSAHGAPLQTSFRIEFDQFVILAVDELSAGVSGCSIDGMVRILQGLQQQIGADFFDRQQVAFLRDGKIALYPVSGLKALFEANVLTGENITFNNGLTSKADWEKSWKVSARNSWLARYLPKSTGVSQSQ